MVGSFSLVQLLLSVLIFMVMFFGIGFLLNMLLRVTWFTAMIYPIIVIFIIDEVSFFDYFTKPGTAFSMLWNKVLSLHSADIIILSSGMLGAVIAGFVMKYLRKNGYQMF